MVMRACLIGTMIDVVVMMGRQWYDKHDGVGVFVGSTYLLYIQYTQANLHTGVRSKGCEIPPYFFFKTHESKLRYETTPPSLTPPCNQDTSSHRPSLTTMMMIPKIPAYHRKSSLALPSRTVHSIPQILHHRFFQPPSLPNFPRPPFWAYRGDEALDCIFTNLRED